MNNSKNIRFLVKEWKSYILSKALIIVAIAVVAAILGITYAWLQKAKYTAEITFAPENDKGSAGVYAGLAAQFGLDIGGGSGGVFEGESMIEFLKSKMLIEKALFNDVQPNGKNQLLINYYVESHYADKNGRVDRAKFPAFTDGQMAPLRTRDSILNKIIDDLGKQLVIEKVSKTANIVSVRLTDKDELFAKLFVEALVATGIEYYKAYRSKKNRENVSILQRQTDSVRGLLTHNIVAVAQSTDLNVNPARQVVRTSSQRSQVDVQVNGQVYGELLKQLELSRITLRKETPFVQVLDTPRLPLEKKKMGRLMAGILFGFLGGFFALCFFIIKKVMLSNTQN
jgi:uncharacterized protein involved in exopolysaccharide biosynthesis